jgi:hypothetical protein
MKTADQRVLKTVKAALGQGSIERVPVPAKGTKEAESAQEANSHVWPR